MCPHIIFKTFEEFNYARGGKVKGAALFKTFG